MLIVLAGLGSVTDIVVDAIRDPSKPYRDFVYDQASARAVYDGKSPYAPTEETIPRFPEYAKYAPDLREVDFPQWHPPLRILIQLPFGWMSFLSAYLLWLAISLTSLVAALFLVARKLGCSRNTGLVIAVGSLAFPIARNGLESGRYETLILLLLVLAWRARRDRIAGTFLGVAVALQIFPAFLALPLVFTRRKVVWTAAAIAAAGVLLPWLLLGAPTDYIDQFEGFRRWGGAASISLNHVLRRAPILALVLSGLLAVVALQPPRNASHDAVWATVPLMLLATPIVWVTYLIVAFPWFMLMIARTTGVRRIACLLVVLAGVIDVPNRGLGFWALAITPVALAAGILIEAIPRGSVEFGRELADLEPTVEASKSPV